jgi:hypothetical protein
VNSPNNPSGRVLPRPWGCSRAARKRALAAQRRGVRGSGTRAATSADLGACRSARSCVACHTLSKSHARWFAHRLARTVAGARRAGAQTFSPTAPQPRTAPHTPSMERLGRMPPAHQTAGRRALRSARAAAPEAALSVLRRSTLQEREDVHDSASLPGHGRVTHRAPSGGLLELVRLASRAPGRARRRSRACVPSCVASSGRAWRSGGARQGYQRASRRTARSNRRAMLR